MDMLSFYSSPPQQAVQLEEFETIGHVRLKLLGKVVGSDNRSNNGIDFQRRRWEGLMGETQEFQQLAQDPSLDILSHYALRLAFCKYRDHWEWFVNAELQLFILRLSILPPNAAVDLLAREGIQYESIAINDQNGFSFLQQQWLEWKRDGIDCNCFYRVPFEHIANLVKHRRVLLKNGFCIIDTRDMMHVAAYHFRRIIVQHLVTFQRALLAKTSDLNRLQPILDEFVREYQKQAHVNINTRQMDQMQISVEDIDRIAVTHFPLCMRHLHRKLRENHHLKYGGRLQYRMFLKGIGFSVHDSIQFFRSEFVQMIPAAEFDREYAYHIRHSYGLEGAHKDYTPFDCVQIINRAPPRHGQYHGCPFKHWDQASLQAEFRQNGLSVTVASRIAHRAASSGEPQAACRQFFDATHRVPYAVVQEAAAVAQRQRQENIYDETKNNDNAVVLHPNTWLEASLRAGNQNN